MEKIKASLSVSYGHGYGDGDGYGYGYGQGYGYGDGYGYGHGDGDGDGHGYGNGYGHGDGIKNFCGDAVYEIDGVQTIIKRLHGSYAKGFILRDDLTLAPCYVVKYGNYFAHGKTLREAREAAITKAMNDMPAEDRVAAFWKHHNRTDRYPVTDFFEWHNRLTGSCEMGRREFAKEHEIDLENGEMTVDEFIKLTENAYGGEIIRKLKKKA